MACPLFFLENDLNLYSPQGERPKFHIHVELGYFLNINAHFNETGIKINYNDYKSVWSTHRSVIAMFTLVWKNVEIWFRICPGMEVSGLDHWCGSTGITQDVQEYVSVCLRYRKWRVNRPPIRCVVCFQRLSQNEARFVLETFSDVLVDLPVSFLLQHSVLQRPCIQQIVALQFGHTTQQFVPVG